MNIRQPLERWPLVHLPVGSITAFRAGMPQSSATKRGIVLIWCARRVASAFGDLGMVVDPDIHPKKGGRVGFWGKSMLGHRRWCRAGS